MSERKQSIPVCVLHLVMIAAALLLNLLCWLSQNNRSKAERK